MYYNLEHNKNLKHKQAVVNITRIVIKDRIPKQVFMCRTSILTSFQVLQAPQSWSKYSTLNNYICNIDET